MALVAREQYPQYLFVKLVPFILVQWRCLSVISTATRGSVYVINYKKVNEATKVLTPKKGEVMRIVCMCKVSDTQVSSLCTRQQKRRDNWRQKEQKALSCVQRLFSQYILVLVFLY